MTDAIFIEILQFKFNLKLKNERQGKQYDMYKITQSREENLNVAPTFLTFSFSPVILLQDTMILERRLVLWYLWKYLLTETFNFSWAHCYTVKGWLLSLPLLDICVTMWLSSLKEVRPAYCGTSIKFPEKECKLH